jgi:hypothetical protein
MHSKRLTILLPLLVVLTMLASLITPSPVLAANEPPPPPPGEKSPKAPAALDKPAPPASDADTSYTAEIPVAAPVGAPDGAANAAAVALSVDAIAQADAVLVGPNGNPLPMAARDTVNALVIGDVYFKGSGPACIAGFCYYDTIVHALADFHTRNGSGMIYVPGSINELTPVNVDGLALTLTKLTGLAWNDYDNYSPRLTGGALTITNMLKGFTVDGFYISHGIYAHDNTGTLRLQNLYVTNSAGDGIKVITHTGNIDLFNVTVSQTGANGAWLDNCIWNGATSRCDGTGNVTISNSSFNANHGYGMVVSTNGSVLLDRVEASNNLQGEGAHLGVYKGATVKDSRFNGNLGSYHGLTINGSGAFILQNVAAQDNSWRGIDLNTANDITVNGALLTGNSGYALSASSTGGNITLNNIKTNGNSFGVTADNSHSVAAKTVTVTNSRFTGTSAAGLEVYSKGNVTLNHIVAEGNIGNGITIDNAQLVGIIYKGSGSVSILNTLGANELLNNTTGAALDIKSKGAITIKGVYAYSNKNGLKLENCAMEQNPALPQVCLGKSNFSVTATRLVSSGLSYSLNASTGGAITLDGDNFLTNNAGVTLDNTQASSAKPVTVTSSAFSNTSGAGFVPLSVVSKGSITLNNVQAEKNAATGDVIHLDNCFLNGGPTCKGTGSVSVLGSLGPTILLNNNATTMSLSILSHGAVTLNGVFADYNRSGVMLHTGTAAVTISKSSFSHNSVLGGLYVLSAGKITLTSVNASYNNGASGGGADLENDVVGATASATITLSKSLFDSNNGYGLLTAAMGSLTANNISAMSNAGFGAHLTSLKGNVALQDSLGANQFNSNGQDGLTVISGKNAAGTWGGTISLRGVIAHDNVASYGIKVDNQYATTPKTVTIQKVSVERNGTDGLDVLSKGSVTLNNVQADYNANGWGVNIDNCRLDIYPHCTGNGNVSLLSTLGANSMSYNLTGMKIYTLGSVVVNGLTASDNSGSYGGVSGLFIFNQFQPAVQKPVTVTQSSFDANHDTGLSVTATGVITLNGISASNNVTVTSGYGLYLYNYGEPGSPGVNILATLGNNQFNNNYYNGIHIVSSGNIVLNKVTANENGWPTTRSGVYLETHGASSITITCSVFNHNGKYGLEVSMGTGTLTFKSVAANHNDPVLGDLKLPVGTVPVQGWTVCGK